MEAGRQGSKRRQAGAVRRMKSPDGHPSGTGPQGALLSWLVMLVEQQIAERRERAAAAIAKVLERPSSFCGLANVMAQLSR
jgi:hypothetical protein